MDYRIKRFLLAFSTLTLVLGAWLWTTAEEFEEEQAWVVPERFQPPKPEVVEEEPEYVFRDPPPPNFGWVYPPKQVRKTVGKIKKKIKPKKQ